MKIEDQVCSLELAKRLKELGVKQDSIIYWLNIQHCVHMKVKDDGYTLQEDENGNPMIDKIDYRTELGNPFVYNIDKDNCWCAFTVAELGKMLPDSVVIKTFEYFIKSQKKDDEYKIYIEELSKVIIFFDINEANARAKMLIYLIENKLLLL